MTYTLWFNKFTKEYKKVCECGARHPLHHRTCLACGRRLNVENPDLKLNEAGKKSLGKVWSEII